MQLKFGYNMVTIRLQMVTKRLQFTQSCKANTTRRYSNYVLQFRLRFPAEAAVRLFRQVLTHIRT